MIMYALSILILVSIVLVLFIIIVYSSTRHLKSDYHSLKTVLDNLHTYAFLVNENVGVEQTNYYALNPDAKHDQPLILGNVLRCKNGCDAGLCGTSPFCSRCTIRQHISKAFQTGTSFSNVESHMQLYTPNHNVVETDVVVGGRYGMINNKPHLVVDVNDVTQAKTLENLYLEEKEKSLLDVKRLRGHLVRIVSNISSPFNTLNGYVNMFKTAKTEDERQNSAQFIGTQSSFIKKWFDEFFNADVIKDINDMSPNNSFSGIQGMSLSVVALVTDDKRLPGVVSDYTHNKYCITVFKKVEMIIRSSSTIAAVILDISFERNGLAVAELRLSYPQIPIIIIADIENCSEALIKDNYVYYIRKSFTQQELLRSLDVVKVSSIS